MLHRIVAMKMPLPVQILPAGFMEISPSPMPYSRAYLNSWGLKVIVSIDTMVNGHDYIHCSVSKDNRLPTWDELLEAKNLFIGRDKEAFQFFPVEKEYVNLCKNCLHIWCCLTKDIFK